MSLTWDFFGSKSWAIIPIDKRKSFQSQSSECILLGYVEDAKAYKLMEIATRRCFIGRSVHLNEDPLQILQLVEEEGRSDLPTPFAHDEDQNDVSSDDLDLEFEYGDQFE